MNENKDIALIRIIGRYVYIYIYIARTIVNKINILYDNIETFAITNIVESFYVLTDRNREIKLVLIEHQSSPFP